MNFEFTHGFLHRKKRLFLNLLHDMDYVLILFAPVPSQESLAFFSLVLSFYLVHDSELTYDVQFRWSRTHLGVSLSPSPGWMVFSLLCWWPWALFCYCFGLLSFKNFLRFHSKFYWPFEGNSRCNKYCKLLFNILLSTITNVRKM